MFSFAKEKADVRDVTGCLAKGDNAKEFLLTGNDGSDLAPEKCAT